MREFRPSRYEVFGNDDPRFSSPMHHALKCRDRLDVALRSGLRRQPQAREYARHELSNMLRSSGFEIAESRHFLGKDTQDCRLTAQQQAINWAKWPFYAVPHLRGSLLVVGRKR